MSLEQDPQPTIRHGCYGKLRLNPRVRGCGFGRQFTTMMVQVNDGLRVAFHIVYRNQDAIACINHITNAACQIANH
ncbi:MAG: hypothetical protein WCT12_23195, partial [Verrucomicrobiota bacterium]